MCLDPGKHSMTVTSALAQDKGSGSFPLADLPELLELDNIDLNLTSVSNANNEELASVAKVSPGHHRASLLLDGTSCSSSGSITGSSTHSTPAGSLDGCSAASHAAALEARTCLGVSAAGVAADVLGSTDSISTCKTDPAGNPMQIVLDPAATQTDTKLTNSSNSSPAGPQQSGLTVVQQSTDAAETLVQGSCPAPASMNSSSNVNMNSNSNKGASSHVGLGTLQLPDFFTFALPEECAFTESMDHGLTTPTPHTPVVQSIFAGEGLPLVSARTCRPHYSTSASGSAGGGSDSSSSNGGGSGDGSSSNPTPAATAAAEWKDSSSGSGSSSMQQLGTCRVLLLDNGDDDNEFDIDPFPAAVLSSPTSHRIGISAADNDFKTYAGLDVQTGWESPGFTSLLCRRTLSTVSEAPNKGEEDSQSGSSTPAEARAAAARAAAAVPAAAARPAVQLAPVTKQATTTAPSTATAEPTATPVEGAAHDSSAAQQQQQQGPGLQQQGDYVEPAADLAGAADAAAVVLELACDSSGAQADAATQQQQQQQKAACMEGAGIGMVGTAVAPAMSSADSSQQQQQQQQEAASDAADGAAALETVVVQVAGKATDCSSCSGSGGSRVVAVSATATAAALGEEEDVWEVANKQRLQQLQEQQPVPSVLLTYPSAEGQLLAAAASAAGVSSSGVHLQQQRQHAPGFLQRLLLCGCSSNSSSSWHGSQGQQQQQQCQQVLQLSRTPFSNQDAVHLALLQALYSSYTGKPGPVPRLGPHWADLGFQGEDPATDLRAAGVLGLLQLLFLHSHDAAAAHKIYQLSQSPVQELPLAIVSFNVTAWTLGVLQAGKLDRAARQLGGHMTAANRFYCGAMYEFYSRWLNGHKTMLESGFVLKQLEKYCRSHCKEMLQLAAGHSQLP